MENTKWRKTNGENQKRNPNGETQMEKSKGEKTKGEIQRRKPNEKTK